MQRNILSKEKRKESEVELMPSNPHAVVRGSRFDLTLEDVESFVAD